MKTASIIAPLTALLTTSLANATVFTNLTSEVDWMSDVSAVYTSPAATYYNDTLGNIAQAGSNVTGGHGWGVFTASPLAGTTVLADTVSPNMIIANGGAGRTNFEFTFANSTGAAGGMYAVGFYFNVSDTTKKVAISATFGAVSAGVNQTFLATNNWVGFYSDVPAGLLTVTFLTESGSSNMAIEITEIVYGLVPAPGAVALLGVAGLVSTRRRRA